MAASALSVSRAAARSSGPDRAAGRSSPVTWAAMRRIASRSRRNAARSSGPQLLSAGEAGPREPGPQLLDAAQVVVHPAPVGPDRVHEPDGQRLVGRQVGDLPRSTAFYRAVFGFDVLAERADGDRRSPSSARRARWCSRSGSRARARSPPTARGCTTSRSRWPTSTPCGGRGHAEGLGVAFAYDGIVPHGEGASSGGVFFTDPDRIRLEVYAPTGADVAPAPVPAAPTCGFF